MTFSVKENPNDAPGELGRLSEEEFKEWLRGKEQADIMSLHHETHENLGDLRESLDPLTQQKFEIGEKRDKSSVSSQPSVGKRGDIFSDRISTRKPEDVSRNFVQGATESLIMPLKIALDSTKDLGKFILSPRAEIRRTIAALESESTAKII